MFDSGAWAAYLTWPVEAPKAVERLNQLIGECSRHPFTGTGKPEPLKRTLAEWWSGGSVTGTGWYTACADRARPGRWTC